MDDRIFTSLERDSERLFHYGTPHQGSTPHSGRYAWGSGDTPLQNATDIRAFAYEMRRKKDPKTGERLYSDTEIARMWGVSSNEFRKLVSIDRNQERAANISRALKYQSEGMSTEAIAEKMGHPPSTVRSWLEPKAMERASSTRNVADVLKSQCDEKRYLDVGKGVAAQLNVSNEKLKNAVKMLREEGYKVQTIKVEQATNPQQKTTIQVLTKDDVPWNEVWENRDQIRSPLGTWTEDDGKSWRNVKEPVSISSDRIDIRYGDEGAKREGLVEIRPGVEDLALGQNHYAQVRIAVDGSYYIKGMAVYSDDLPPGKDIRINTYKTSDVPMMGPKDNSILKPFKKDKLTGEVDEDNPFGSTVRQFDYIGADGKEHQSAINLVNTDEDWNKWSKTLSSQMLSKQYVPLAKKQLNLVYQEKKDLFEDIKKISNETIKQKLLEDLAEDCDSAAVHLKAAALPRQETKVILPLEHIKDNEVYAPTYKDGEEVILIRYPHQGTFEIPRLIVNNRNPEGKKVIGNADKAIGINLTVAQQLSGADFDGDTVTVIPTANQNLKTSKPLKGLEGFDPKVQYKAYEGMTPVGPKKRDENDKPKPGSGDGFNTQMQMGMVSNLITDMTLKGASEAEIVRATKHALVVIDAEKHQLNWKLSEQDQQIDQLKAKYQSDPENPNRRGASTIISRAKSVVRVPLRADRPDIDPETGELTPKTAKDAVWTDKEGNQHTRIQESTRMAETKDAYTLVSRDESGATTRMEEIYADHANRLKALANEVRKEYMATPNGSLNREAASQYDAEVKSLEDKLRLAELNAPRERLANAAADKYMAGLKKTRDLSKEEEKKIRSQVIEATRHKAGASSRKERGIKTTDREWEAIVAGALSREKIRKILTYMDKKEILTRTLPRDNRGVSPAKQARAKALLAAGFTWSEVADAVGVSESTLRSNLK